MEAVGSFYSENMLENALRRANDQLSCRAATDNPNLFVRSEQVELSWPLRGQLQRHVSRAPHPNSSLLNNQIALLLNALSYAGSVRSGLAGGYAT